MTRAMLVKQFGTPEEMNLASVEVPEPGPGEVQIDVRAMGINFPDLLVIGGTYQILPELPFSPGKEVAGVVEELGPGVDEFEVGERVMAQMEYGGYSEKVVVKATHTASMPQQMSFEEAAGFGLAYLTAYFGLVRRANLQPGETILVTGAAGGVGLAGVQLAKALGARVIAVASTEVKRSIALEAGADDAIAPDLEGFKEQVLELTGGRGADVILESVGGSRFQACMRALAWEGRLVIVGFAGGDIPKIKAGHVLVKNISILGLHSSDYWQRQPEKTMRKAQKELLQLYDKGLIKVRLHGVYPLERAADALRVIRNGDAKGKLVLTTGGPEHRQEGGPK